MAGGDGGARAGIPCDLCGVGPVVRRTEPLRFRQRTDRGTAECRIRLAIGRCDTCGAAHLDATAEALIEAAVLQAYVRLPLRSANAPTP